MASEPEFSPYDPLGLKRIEHEIRIEKLRQDIKEVTGEESLASKADCEPELEEAFLENVLALERHGFVCPFEILTRDGFSLPPPEELDDAALPGRLQELITAMRYYTDEEERARWAAQFPDFPMPPRQEPPFDRDRHLPQPEPPG